MLKNGYIEVVVDKPVIGLEKGEIVFALSNEFGQIGSNASISVIKCDDKKTKIIIPKENLSIKNK